MKINEIQNYIPPTKTQINSNPNFKENGSTNRNSSINKNNPAPPVVFSDPLLRLNCSNFEHYIDDVKLDSRISANVINGTLGSAASIGFGLTKRIPFRYKPFAIGISIATALGSLPETQRFVIANFLPKLYLLTNKSRHHFATRILNARIDSGDKNLGSGAKAVTLE
ncbi:hypothetical protein HOG98_03680 [bacterium]|jgi:hypothetical protein|nr:hypothetical protein [bacterium]